MINFNIVTINWNNLPGLVATYKSLNEQAYKNYRWIVIDGASKDGSLDWLESLNNEKAEITSQPDKGIYDAMNKGLLKALESPGYTLFLNSGDTFANTEVLEQVSAAIQSSSKKPLFVYGDFFIKLPSGKLNYKAAKAISKLKLGLPASHQTMYFANDGLRHVTFRTKYKLSADYCMLIEFLKNSDLSKDVIKLKTPLCIFDTTGASNTRRFEAIKEDMDIRMKYLSLPALEAFSLYVLHYFHTHLKNLKVMIKN